MKLPMPRPLPKGKKKPKGPIGKKKTMPITPGMPKPKKKNMPITPKQKYKVRKLGGK